MAQTLSLAAERRERAGKGAARATRRSGRVPGIIYGNKMPPVNISFDENEFKRHYHTAGFFTHIFEVSVGGEKHRVLPRDVQVHPVTDRPIHVDFMRFSADTKVAVEVEVTFINQDQCPGLRKGGLVNVVRHEVEVLCPPDRIPERLVVDLAGLEIGDSVHISAIALPEGVRPTITDRDFTVATIAAPTVMEAEEAKPAAAEGAAPAAGDKAAGGTDTKES